MQKFAKKIVVAILGWQVRRLRARNDFKVVAVAGSLGKTSTKRTIATVLKARFKVQFQDGNYNDIVTVPLIFFGRKLPSLFNPLAWLKIFLGNENQLRKKYPYEIVVVEVGSDGPGQIKQYSRYFHADIGLLTGIAPEHMEYFGTLEAVAKEEASIAQLCDKLFYNPDFIDQQYSNLIPSGAVSYAIKQAADYKLTDIKFDGLESSFSVVKNNAHLLTASHELIAQTLLYSTAAAVAVADDLGMSVEEIKNGLAKIKPASGRMQILNGINRSTIIDDTYNATPQTFKAALDTLYRLKAPQKIAILGSMNELGKYSAAAHREVGRYLDPNQINILLTVGEDANKIIAAEAEARGFSVQRFNHPVTAGQYIRPLVKEGALILAKGSQNKIFLEETIKCLLANPDDTSKLVRQGDYWQRRKAKVLKGLA